MDFATDSTQDVTQGGKQSSSPWKPRHARNYAASFGQMPGNIITMRSFADLNRADGFDRGPGTPDVVLHYGRRPGSRARSSSLLSGKLTPPSFACVPEFEYVTPSMPPPVSGHLSAEEPPAQTGQRQSSTNLIMPSARRASAILLNESSPPLSPVSDGFRTDRYGDSHSEVLTPTPMEEYSLGSTILDTSSSTMTNTQAGSTANLAKVDTFWQDILSWRLTGSQQRRASPPSSFDSTAPSWTWSSQSYEDNGIAPILTTKYPSLLTQVKQSVTNLFSASYDSRADIDSSGQSLSWSLLLPHAHKVLLLGTMFLCATIALGFLLSTLPLHLPKHLTHLTVSEISDICTELQKYAYSSSQARLHVFFVLAFFFTWKQAFCVPGSLIMNIVFGAMYGSYVGSLYTSVLTGFGGMLCYLLASPFSEVVTLFPKLAKPLLSMRKALQSLHYTDEGETHRHSSPKLGRDLWSYLLFLRLLPIVPYGMMNIACGVLNVPLLPYTVTLAIGSVPWNFCTTQIGEILQNIASAIQSSAAASTASSDGTTLSSTSGQASMLANGAMTLLWEHVWTFDMMIKLILLSIASALPLILHRIYGQRRGVEAQMEEGDSDSNTTE